MTKDIPTRPTSKNGLNGTNEAENPVEKLTKIPPIENSIPLASDDPHQDLSPKTSASTFFNVEMDSLTEKLEGLGINDSAPMESKSVTVPAGFRLAMQVSPSEFFRLKGEIKKSNKRKREQGLLSKSSRAKIHYGFRPEEVLWHGALLKQCKPSNLSNDIHPLLHHSRFDDCPDTIYNELRPGLHLATMFLTQPICSQFWLTLADGERKTDSKLSWLNNVKCQRIEKNVPMTKENTANVIEYIRQLDKANMIHWSFQHDLVVHDEFSYGATRWVCDNHHELPRGPNTTLVPQHIRIHADMYTVACKFSKLEHADTAQKLRFSFFVAVLICHELAHAVEGTHRRGRPLGADLHIEPWLFDDNIAEMGRAWESITLGGTVHPINAAVDCSHGIGTWDWPEVDSEVNWERSLKYSVPMTYIENLFQMETWQRDFNLDNWKTFHIPRDGAISVNMNNLTTMPWSEEVRVAREELEESVSASDLDEPAAKKREIATGEAVISSSRFEEGLESIEEAPPIAQTSKKQERTIITPTTKSRKQRRNEKRAERKVTDDKSALPNRGDPQGMEQPTEGMKVAIGPEKPIKKNGKGKEKAIETEANVEKNQPKLNVAAETDAAIAPEKRPSTAEKQPFPAPEHPVAPQEESSAAEPTPATDLPVVSKQSEQPLTTVLPAVSETQSRGEEHAVTSTEPVRAEVQPAVEPTLSTAILNTKTKK